MRDAIVKSLAIILGIILLTLPYASPALQRFIDPAYGVMAAADTGGLPKVTLHLTGINGEAEVYFDRFGVPHIYATTDEAGFYAMGWVTASQRLFQMDLLRRLGEGRLAELVGKDGLDTDKFMIMSGIADSVQRSWEAMSADPQLKPVVDMLEAYSKGVNDYIDYAMRNNLLPVEYRVLGQTPEYWSPVDTIAVARVIAYVLAWNDEDLVVQHIINRYGKDAVRIAEVFDWLTWNGTVTQADCKYAVSWAGVTGLNHTATFAENTVPDSPGEIPVEKILSMSQEPLNYLGVTNTFLEASNNWVVNGSYTLSRKPIVANDPHLELSVPPIWFLAELKTPNYHVIGALFPGTPLVIIGRNEHIAWGFTNVMGDFTDYYYYKWSSDGKYLYKGKWLEPEKEERVIRVWDPVSGKYSEERITVEKTVHGYVLNVGGEKLAVRWTGHDPSFEVAFFYYLDKASTVKEALQAQRYFHVPVQNFVVADDKGNFAYSPFGGFPNRTNLPVYNIDGHLIVNTGFLPFNGSKGEGEWQGYIPPNRIPILYNPPVPFVATANSKVWNGTCGDFIGWHYHDKYREERITGLLQFYTFRGMITMRDMASIQLDQRDLGVLDYLHTLLNLVKDKKDPYLDKVRWWYGKYRMAEIPYISSRDPNATIAIAWLFTFHKNLWTKIYGSPEHLWFFRAHYALSFIKSYEKRDPLTKRVMGDLNLEDLAYQSLKEAVENLTRYFGTQETGKWLFGKVHYYSPYHPAFKTLNYPREPAGGATWSINVAPIKEFTVERGMPVTVGPSIRMVVDLGTSHFWIQLPGGESGSPYSNHYYDMYERLWLRGVYVDYDLNTPPSIYGDPYVIIIGGS